MLLLFIRVTLCLRHTFSSSLLYWSNLLEWTLPSYLLITLETAIFLEWVLTSFMRSSIFPRHFVRISMDQIIRANMKDNILMLSITIIP